MTTNILPGTATTDLDLSGGARFARLVEQARLLGLEVEIDTSRSDHVLQSVSARIRRPQVEERTVLDVVENSDFITVHATRSFGEGRWSTAVFRRCGAGVAPVRLHSAPYFLDGMVSDL